MKNNFTCTDQELLELQTEFSYLHDDLIRRFRLRGRSHQEAIQFAKIGFPYFCEMVHEINQRVEQIQST